MTGWEVGARAGIGCFVRSCRDCKQCRKSVDQYCKKMVRATSHILFPWQHHKKMACRCRQQSNHNITSTLQCSSLLECSATGRCVTAKVLFAFGLPWNFVVSHACADQRGGCCGRCSHTTPRTGGRATMRRRAATATPTSSTTGAQPGPREPANQCGHLPDWSGAMHVQSQSCLLMYLCMACSELR